jgi:hypothetical protein
MGPIDIKLFICTESDGQKAKILIIYFNASAYVQVEYK